MALEHWMKNKEGYRHTVRIIKRRFLGRNGYVKAPPTYVCKYIASFVTFLIKVKILTLSLVNADP
jgi:hypothetical protein